jgi:hypothetical protein
MLRQLPTGAPSPVLAWIVIASFTLISVFGAFAGLGKLLNYIVPAGAFLVGLFLFFRYPILYVEFVWWVWFIAPLVRRFVDYRSGFTDPSPVLLAPYLATLPTTITVFRQLPRLNREGGLPFILAMAGVVYSFSIGILTAPLQSVLLSLLDWLTPLTFGCHLFTRWREYPLYRKSINRTFFWCVLLAGSYGIYQYIVAPEWDRFWLTQLIDELGIVTFGKPEPQGMRVWGTMHGPLIFAASMSAGLLLLLSQTKPLANIATVIGFLAFLLSQVRTSWLGLAVGLVLLVTSMKQSLQIRLIVIISILAGCIFSLAMIEPFSEVISTRTNTLTDLQGDTSAIERRQTYDRVLNDSLFNVLGNGLSKSDGADSGVLEILMKLGWIGGVFYGSGMILLLLIKPDQGSDFGKDVFAKTSNAIAFGLFAQLPFGGVMIALPGVILWGFLGIKLAAWKYHSSSKSTLPDFSTSARSINPIN